jgi:hypothetical protein
VGLFDELGLVFEHVVLFIIMKTSKGGKTEIFVAASEIKQQKRIGVVSYLILNALYHGRYSLKQLQERALGRECGCEERQSKY